MGEVVGAGLLAHVPTIVLPEETRRELNHGEDSTLVSGLHQLRREVFDTLDYDTVVVLDSHWATTVEFVVTAQDRRSGLFTSEELPRGMSRRRYDFPGDPELAHLIASKADRHSTWITPIEDHHLPIFYATTNLWEFLGDGLPDKRWISIGVCQTADGEDSYRLVQRNAMKVWEQGKDFLEELLADPEVRAALSEEDIREKFDLGYHTKHVDTIFGRVFGKA